MFSYHVNGVQEFPILSELWHKLSLIFPSEAAAERAFKKAKLFDTPQRNHTPANLSKHVFFFANTHILH